MKPPVPAPAPVWEAPNLLALGAPLRHGFFGRQGGVSQGIYASLNCGRGSRDAKNAVAANCARAAAAVDADPDCLILPRQSHSTQAVLVQCATDKAPRADALITQTPGLALGVLAADCAPILLCDDRKQTIAVIHAGWRGAAAGIVERTLEQMAELGAPPERLHAAIGPCIGANAYQVGADMRAQVCAQSPDASPYFAPAEIGHYRFDLSGFLAMRLARAKLRSCTASPLCTHSSPALLFSYRRSCRENAPDYGRQISLLCLSRAARRLQKDESFDRGALTEGA